MQPDDVNLWYFKYKLFDLTAFIVWNIESNDIEIRKLEFAAKTQFLYVKLNLKLTGALSDKTNN